MLAVKGTAAAERPLLRRRGQPRRKSPSSTRPIQSPTRRPPNGVVKFFTNYDESLMEQLQREFTGARFVKAFNSVGAACMVNPQFKGGTPTMFICGNDEEAKKIVSQILY